MIESICIFEDEHFSQFYPLSLTRPVFDLRCGFSTLKDKIIHKFPLSAVSLHCRDYLKNIVQEQNPGIKVNEVDSEECLFVNGRSLIDEQFLHRLDTTRECIYFNYGDVVAAFLRGSNVKKVGLTTPIYFDENEWRHIEKSEIDANLISYPWDLINENPAEIVNDFNALDKGGEIHGTIYDSSGFLNTQQIYVAPSAISKPGVVLDAENGPIYVGNNVTLMANAVIEGPAFIGDNSIIKIGAKIYEGTSIGEVCKVGGEVEESIIHSYSNKQHDGFLGHAYLGQWVNLGADTNNSDLKNNYGSVKVPINGKVVDSGLTFVGLFMGDHSKTGINTMFNTGTVVGIMSNVFGSGFPPKFIPSFTWGGSAGLDEYDINRGLETARRVMARRKVETSSAYDGILRHIFKLTQGERDQL